MGYTKYVYGAQPTEGQFQDLMDQGIIRCTSSTRPQDADRTNGMRIFETDTYSTYRCDGAGLAGVWRQMNGNVAWTPVVSQGGTTVTWNPLASYVSARVAEEIYHLTCKLSLTSAGTGTGQVAITTPVNINGAYRILGRFWNEDTGTTLYSGDVLADTNRVLLQAGGSTGLGLTLASTDIITAQFSFW